MGGRGAQSGINLYPGCDGKMFRYGEEFRTLGISDEIKFITVRNPTQSLRMPRKTRSTGRIHALVGSDGMVKSIGTHGPDGRIETRIDVDHFHSGLKPHIHRDAWNHDNGVALDASEKKLVEYILKKGEVALDKKQPDIQPRRASDLQTEEDWRVLLEEFGHIWFVLDGQRYFVFPEGPHRYGLCLGEDEKTGNFPRWVFESEDAFLSAKLFGGRCILERLDEVMVYTP